VGKTDIAIDLALALNGEILSADSRQIYKELNIGTAKPINVQLEAVVHHFINSHSITDRYTVFDYAREAHEILSDLHQRQRNAFLVGGSGLFVNAVVDGLDEFPEVATNIRQELNRELKQEGLQTLFEKLKQQDPVYAEVVDQNNPRRVIRALEICRGTGKPFSSFLGKKAHAHNYSVNKIGLEIPREELYVNIDKRVDTMINQGLVEEARGLYKFREIPAMRTVGYQELMEYFEDKVTLKEAIEKIKRNTRRYAKRQLTWFKKDANIKWFQPTERDQIMEYVKGAVGI